MSVDVGLYGVGILLLLLLLRVPVALAMITVSFGGIAMLLGFQPALGIVTSTPYSFVASWTMSAVPMFLLMGFIAFHAGLTTSLFDAAKAILWRVPGGLAFSSIFACTGFASVSGSSIACAAAMGRIAIPEMVAAGYRPSFAAGAIAADMLTAYLQDERQSRTLHDPCVMLLALEPALFTLDVHRLTVNLGDDADAGALTASASGSPVVVAMGIDAPGALALLARGFG